MKIIDAHNHPYKDTYDINKYLENMDLYGIDQTWLLNVDNGEDSPVEFDEGRVSFARCMPYAKDMPQRFILGYCPDPRRKDAVDRLLKAYELYNIKVCGELKLNINYDCPEALKLFQVVGELGLPVIFHLQYNLNKDDVENNMVGGGSIENVENMLKKSPNTIFLGHATGFWSHISDDDLWSKYHYPPESSPVIPGGKVEELLDKYPNLYCDISAGSGCNALARDLDFTVNFFKKYHNRILYGRDCFDNRHKELIKKLNLPTSILEEIYFRNAEKLIAK